MSDDVTRRFLQVTGRMNFADAARALEKMDQDNPAMCCFTESVATIDGQIHTPSTLENLGTYHKCTACGSSLTIIDKTAVIVSHECPHFYRIGRIAMPKIPERKTQKKRPRDGKYGPQWGFRK